jgi:hypothetical protein
MHHLFAFSPESQPASDPLWDCHPRSALHGNNSPQCCVARRGNAIGAAVGLLLDPALPQHSGNNLRACWMQLFWPTDSRRRVFLFKLVILITDTLSLNVVYFSCWGI